MCLRNSSTTPVLVGSGIARATFVSTLRPRGRTGLTTNWRWLIATTRHPQDNTGNGNWQGQCNHIEEEPRKWFLRTFYANNEIIEVKEDSLEIYFFQISSVNRGTFYLSVKWYQFSAGLYLAGWCGPYFLHELPFKENPTSKPFPTTW